MSENRVVPRRIAQILIQSLKAGVVPRIGLPYITVGRNQEIDALLYDIEMVQAGGASFRFIEGKYGAGKSFLLQAVRNFAMDRGFIVMDGDLSPKRRLQGNKGQGLALYKELIQNLAVKNRPEGGALNFVLDRWIMTIQTEEMEKSHLNIQDDQLTELVEKRVLDIANELMQMSHGFDFANVLMQYYRAYRNQDLTLKANVTKWFRGEYSLKSEVKRDLGINVMISDDDWYEYLKLFARFFHYAGYQGMMVMVDELVNLYKIPNTITRQYNYEKILTMYNDTLQGKAQYLGIIMCGTPQAIQDERRGLYSYEALRSRLTQGKFSVQGMRDMLAPVIHLDPLKPEELLVLCEKLKEIHAGLYQYQSVLTQANMEQFLQLEYDRIGAKDHITPREVIRDFIELLDILYQNPQMQFSSFVETHDDFFGEIETENFAKFEV